MLQHWPLVTFVADTLAKSAPGLHKNGFDIRFSQTHFIHDRSRLIGGNGRRVLRQALALARRYNVAPSAPSDLAVNMTAVFDRILVEWRVSGKETTTVMVLTDGTWLGTNDAFAFHDMLQAFVSGQTDPWKRPFTIQFIRFGDTGLQLSNVQNLSQTYITERYTTL